jgi:hypothetical protein
MESNEQPPAAGTPDLEADEPAGMTRSSDVTELPEGAVAVDVQVLLTTRYSDTYRTGPFLLPANTHSLDWAVLNNDPAAQTIRVTVFRCPIGGVKTPEPPGPLQVTLAPGELTHNANSYIVGFYYEIQVECNSRLVFPYVSAWPPAGADPLPGSVVKSAEFIRRLA